MFVLNLRTDAFSTRNNIVLCRLPQLNSILKTQKSLVYVLFLFAEFLCLQSQHKIKQILYTKYPPSVHPPARKLDLAMVMIWLPH